jgi:hypothetical protein
MNKNYELTIVLVMFVTISVILGAFIFLLPEADILGDKPVITKMVVYTIGDKVTRDDDYWNWHLYSRSRRDDEDYSSESRGKIAYELENTLFPGEIRFEDRVIMDEMLRDENWLVRSE